jgi:hypothetical protein
LAWFICLMLFPFVSVAQQAGVAVPASVTPPVHPVTGATLRKYFDVCHFAVRNREALEKQFEIQEKQLPAGYPADLWANTVQAVEGIDVAAVALPVYQKYWSEEAAQNAIFLFLTPAGQEMINRVYNLEIKQEVAGDSADEARRQTLAAERAEEDAKVHEMLRSMTPDEGRKVEAFARSAEWKRLNNLSNQIAQEFATVYIAKQKEVAQAVAEKYKSEADRPVHN